jgi:hypothetical protein
LAIPPSPPTREQFDAVFGEQSKANGTVKRHTRENCDKAVHSVQEMEEKMGIEDQWMRESQEYKEAAELVTTR